MTYRRNALSKLSILIASGAALLLSLAACGSSSSSSGGGGGSPNAVNLGTSGTFVILAKAGVDTVAPSVVTGDVGISPAKAAAMTGFGMTMDMSNMFWKSPQVSGKMYASDNTAPTPANLTTAVLDMQAAFTDAAGRAPGTTALGAGDIGGMTLTAGVYKWSTGLDIPTDVTLSGSATDVWIFQVAQNLTMASAKTVHLSGGAQAKHVFWQVAGAVTIGTTAHFEGIILCQTAITTNAGAVINGRLLAQTAVNIKTTTLVDPG